MQATEPGDASAGSVTQASSHRNILATAKGGGFLAAGSMFEFLSRFVIALVLARGLGANDYGLYVLGISAASLFAGISLIGLDDAMVRYVAILSGRKDHDGVSGTLQVGLGVGLVGGLLTGGLLFVFAGPISQGLFNEPALEAPLRVFAIVVPFLTVSNVLLGAARGFKRMDYAAFSEKVVQSVVRLVLVCLIAVVGRLDLYAAAVAFGISDIAASLSLIALLNREFPLKQALRLDVRRDAREIFRFAIPLWLSGLLRQFRRNIQNVMLGAIDTATSVGIFAIVNKVNSVASVASLSIYVAVRPLMAQLHDRRDRVELGRLYTTTTRWTFGLYVPFFLGMVLYPEALLAVFGKAFEAGATALVIVAFAQLANAGTGTCQGMLDMTGHTRAKLGNTILNTVLLVGGGVLLIPRWGVLGAAIASFLAVAGVNAASIVEVWVLERLIPFDRTFVKPLLAGIAAFLVGFALKAAVPVGTHLLLAMAEGVVVAGTYLALVLLLGLAPEDRLVADRALQKMRPRSWRRRAVTRTSGGSA